MPARKYRRIVELPQVIPVFPLDGALLLPGGDLPLQIFEPRYLSMIDDVLAGDRLIGMVQTQPGGDPRKPKLARVGCAGRLTSYSETADGKYLINLMGLCRFETGEEVSAVTPYRQVRPLFARYQDDLTGDDGAVEFERAPFLALLRRYLDNRGLGIEWEAVSAAPAPALINSLAMALPFDPVEKQALLEAPGLNERHAALGALLEIDLRAPTEEDDEPPSLQ